ncbi:SANT/Myb_domain [Hexamita inflata]|uniref:SANT/Myb domain n=1 Tax=Hexamita inflata TaxID=28002 RepID=A0AA86VTN4_9EUKA|nr:SANT/Myb domain [Hexamita inflata]CAI9977578.1 SANT/Myb domain [Hexamita inflata]
MSYSKWTSQEEFQLKAAVDKYRNDWAAIQKLVFPERDAISLKNKYYSRIYKNTAFNTTQSKLPENNQDIIQDGGMSLDEQLVLMKVRALMFSSEF